MRVLFSCTPGEGHFVPLLPLAHAAANHGHAVAFATAAERAPRVEEEGLEALPAGLDLAEAQRRWAPRLAALQLDDVPVEERRQYVFAARFGEVDAPEKLDDLRRLVAGWRPDVVVFESGDLAAPIAAAEAAVPSVHHGFGRTIPSAAVRRAADAVSPLWEGCGLEPDASAGLYRGAYVDIWPASLQNEHPPAEARVQPMRAAERGAPRERRARPLVYATLGTVFNAPERLRVIADAFAGLDVDALITIGRSNDPRALGVVPRNVRIAQYVPQAEVLPYASAVITHGGSGSTLAALAHGCPLVLLPSGADQFDNALACARGGAAVALLPAEQTAERIRESVQLVLRDSEYGDGAERVAAEMAALPGADDVAATLEEWARTSAD